MTMRARWDCMANPKSIKEYAVDSADTINVGDLMWYDRRGKTSVGPGGVARPFNHASLWTGSDAGSRSKAAECFIGVAMSAHDPNSAGRTEGGMASSGVGPAVRIAGAGVFAYPLDTTYTFDVGDLIIPAKDPGLSLLSAQVVAKGVLGPDPQDFNSISREQAIGKVHRRYASLTGVVEFQIKAIHEAGASTRQFLTS